MDFAFDDFLTDETTEAVRLPTEDFEVAPTERLSADLVAAILAEFEDEPSEDDGDDFSVDRPLPFATHKASPTPMSEPETTLPSPIRFLGPVLLPILAVTLAAAAFIALV